MKLILLESAQRELDKIEDRLAFRIFKKLFIIAENPYGLDSKKLEGGEGYRVRIGNYRVVYLVNKQKQTIFIVKIAHRKDVYK